MEVKVGTEVVGRKIAEVGTQNEFGHKNQLLPVKFEDGGYAVLAWSETAQEAVVWLPDHPPAEEAIRNSREMPVARRGIGSEVIHVVGVDEAGPYLVKLFYNYKKQELGREDELHRTTTESRPPSAS